MSLKCMGMPLEVAIPMVALNRVAFFLASAACATMPLGKNILLPTAENISSTMVPFNAVFNSLASSCMMTPHFILLPVYRVFNKMSLKREFPLDIFTLLVGFFLFQQSEEPLFIHDLYTKPSRLGQLAARPTSCQKVSSLASD